MLIRLPLFLNISQCVNDYLLLLLLLLLLIHTYVLTLEKYEIAKSAKKQTKENRRVPMTKQEQTIICQFN